MAVSFLAACNRKSENAESKSTHCIKLSTLPVKYARGFTVDYYNGFKVATVKTTGDSSVVLAQYVILPEGKKAPLDFANAVLIDTPVTKVVCLSTNHIASLSKLGLLQYLKGISNPELIYDRGVQQSVKEGEMVSLGGMELNYEKLLLLHPDFVFTSGDWDGGDRLKMKLASLHIKSVLNLDYMEQDPLARAEWLKFVAVFFDREYEADSIFKEVESKYIHLKDRMAYVEHKPTVLCNMPFKEIWYMPSGENYIARIIKDAGGEFLWSDASATNGLNLSLDYEAVYAKAVYADFWLNTGFARSLSEMVSADMKNAQFRAWQLGQVFNNDLRMTSSGGFDFWESGAVSPDLILSDLVYIFHPDSMPGYQSVYYRKLR